MILPGSESVLHNIQDNFYYNGIEISKVNFDITEFATVCNQINLIKQQIYQEKELSLVKKNNNVISAILLSDNQTFLLCLVNNNLIMMGLYNKIMKEMISLTKDIFNSLNYDDYFRLSNELNRTAKFIERGTVKETTIKDKNMIISFTNYISNISMLSNSFHHTYELEFINNHNDFILTDEKLKDAIK